jgi:SAM-dependent methyltransferase
MIPHPLIALAVTVATILSGAAASAQGRGKMQHIDVPFATTPPAAVAAMLKLAGAGPEDVVYDLGAGDGRIVIAAVRDFGARAGVGIDLDSKRVAEGLENARKLELTGRTRFFQGDAFKVDFSEATILALYMSPRINRELEPRIRMMMKPGARIISYRFPIGHWQPARTIMVGGQPIHLWIVPKKSR